MEHIIEKHWQVSSKLTAEASEGLAGYPSLLKQVLFNRGLGTAQESKHFLAALPPDNNDPFKMKGMEAAFDRLSSAIKKGEPIVVYGDYDADGVTATALLLNSLQALGGQVRPYIPDRFEEGYGLNIAALQQLKEDAAAVVVSVDCGIRSVAEADEAKRLGLDLIITDHHSPGPEMPDAFAVINTKQAGDDYVEKQLAGVGTAFKLACALEQRLGSGTGPATNTLLDLVALGTVADMVPLTGENRWMVREGLGSLRKPTRQGVLSLIGVSGLKPPLVRSGDIGYLLGPRLNAAGRLETAKNALSLLMTNDVFEAGRLAQYLDSQNRERQQLTRQMTASAEEIAASQTDALLITAIHEEYNPGVVGLVASRLVDRFYRPAIVGQRGPEFTRASCRSIPEFHITRALETCADLFRNFGGHAAAAGFTVLNEKLPEALERMQTLAQKQLGSLDLHPVLVADAELPLAELKADILQQLELIEPTGYGNPQVNLVTRGLQVRDARAVGQDGKHLKLTVTDGRITYDAIAFRQGHWVQAMPMVVDLLYRFEANEFNGRSRLQLNVTDLKPSG
ncbi:MAG TPA: single-stranded-DNA-specific exonuclease RecJ [Anaerolineales bacterium]|nr:single-stranded-DNA-specific exonuclease RecJ [Anaerolineales bacterium]HLE74162.1 single-stranded-DNA-specific exonuclease RecJ [Anaerolineales bacterium]